MITHILQLRKFGHVRLRHLPQITQLEVAEADFQSKGLGIFYHHTVLQLGTVKGSSSPILLYGVPPKCIQYPVFQKGNIKNANKS